MNPEFAKLSLDELTKLKQEAEASIKIVAGAVELKERSKGVLTAFGTRINGVMRSPLKVSPHKVERSYGNTTEYRVELLSNGTLSEAFQRVLTEIMSSYRDQPFGLIPMERFWAEWGEAVDNLTKLMVNRYLCKYVQPYPTDTAENVTAYKVMETFEEAAKPGAGA